MKNIIVFLFIFTFPVCGFAQSEKIVAKLIDYDSSKMPAYCGYFTQYGRLKFKISDDYKEIRKGDTILVVLQCPREELNSETGKKIYINNNSFYLKLGKEYIEKDIGLPIFDFRESDFKYPVFGITHIEKK